MTFGLQSCDEGLLLLLEVSGRVGRDMRGDDLSDWGREHEGDVTAPETHRVSYIQTNDQTQTNKQTYTYTYEREKERECERGATIGS